MSGPETQAMTLVITTHGDEWNDGKKVAPGESVQNI